MTDFNILRVMPEDVEMLQTLSRITFYETFSEQNSEKNMRFYLENNLSIERLRGEIENDSSEFYFIISDQKNVGYLKLNFSEAQNELREEISVEIERIYILMEFQRKKMGEALLRFAIERALRNNAAYLWLGVWEKNLPAINFYNKHGFDAFDKHIFTLGDEDQTDILMRLQLN
jgi:ribosomal protein S18 acetylase RimI-like enzyme